MENTPENKAKFFALYWGQKIMRCKTYNSTTGHGVSGLMKVDVNVETVKDNWFLELRPVSSISDEDAKELVKLRFRQDGGDINDIVDIKVSVLKEDHRPNAVYIEAVITHKHWPSFVENVFIGEDTRTSYTLIDFLRSRRYATPCMGLSVKEQIERGWVKLKPIP